jgi:hypothetical protein
MKKLVLIGSVVLAFLIGCNAGSSGVSASSSSRSVPNGSRVPQYQVIATVLQAPGKPPELCSGVLTSLPPQCGGPAITNWKWGAAHGSTTDQGVTWGTYRLIGTYTHRRFTLSQPATTATFPAPAPVKFTPGCSEPSGGWPIASVTFEQWQRFTAAAQSPADFVGLWTVQKGPIADPGKDIYTVVYTGNVATHRAELRAIWPGPLCVIQQPRSMAQLHAIEQTLATNPDGLQVISTGIDPVHDQLTVETVLALPADQRRLDHRFGIGVIRLTSQLQPFR